MKYGNCSFHEQFCIDGKEVTTKKTERDIAIIIDDEVKFHDDTAAKINKSMSVIHQIRRTFITRTKKCE